jgi:hypothetical protein
MADGSREVHCGHKKGQKRGKEDVLDCGEIKLIL